MFKYYAIIINTMSNPFKTICGKKIHDQEIQNKFFENDMATEEELAEYDHEELIVENFIKMINEEISEDDLIDYIIKNPTISFNCIDTFRLSVKKSYDKIIDLYIDSNYDYIINICCTTTDNIYLFKKYYKDKNDSFDYLCMSLIYNQAPSKLTTYISNNYLCVPKINTFRVFSNVDKIISTNLIKYIVSTYDITYYNIDTIELYFKCLTVDDYVEIMEMILINSDIYKCRILFMRNIIHLCSKAHVEYFITKYFFADIVKKIILRAKDVQTLKYLVELVGFDNFDQEYFTELKIIGYDHDMLKWLVDNGFKIIIDSPYDVKIIMLMVDIEIKNANYDKIKSDTRRIITIIFNRNLSTEVINFLKRTVDVFDLDILFEIAIMHECIEIVDLIIINYQPLNIDDIVHDLKLLNKDKIIKRYFNLL